MAEHQDIVSLLTYFQNKNFLKDKGNELQRSFFRSMSVVVRENASDMASFSRSSALFARSRAGWVQRARSLNAGNFYGVLNMLKYQKLSQSGVEFGYRGQRGRRFETGSSVTVTPAMRRLFGLQRSGVANPKPGINIFPLRKETKEIKQPPRPFLTKLANKQDFYESIKMMVGEYYKE